MNTRHLFHEPEAFHNHIVLKNGSALVLKLEMDNVPVVCKIAHANNALLEREAARIQQLSSRYPKLGRRLPEILEQGVIGSGLHRDKTFYIQEFIEGDTLSSVLQKNNLGSEFTDQILRSVVSSTLDMIDEHDFDPGLKGRSGQWLLDYINESYHRLRSLEHIGYLESLDEIIINNRPRESISKCLDKIFSSSLIDRINDGPSIISVLGHWNFHAENVIITSPSTPENYMAIDPDPKIDVCDPMFGLARLLYSFPHDTAEKKQYQIETNIFLPNAAEFKNFEISFNWPQQVIDNYSHLFTGLDANNNYAPEMLDERLADPVLSARLDLSFLYCLLRGIAINHDTYFNVIDNSLRNFQNKGIYLFLTATDFANTVVERIENTK